MNPYFYIRLIKAFSLPFRRASLHPENRENAFVLLYAVLFPLPHEKPSNSRSGEARPLCAVFNTAFKPQESGICRNEAHPTPTTVDADGDILMKSGTSAEALLEQASAGTILLGTDGNPLENGRMPGSGMTLVLPDGTRHTIIVKGDADSDGLISAADARLALRRSVDLEIAVDWRDKASSVDTDGIVTADDAWLILRASVGLETL